MLVAHIVSLQAMCKIRHFSLSYSTAHADRSIDQCVFNSSRMARPDNKADLAAKSLPINTVMSSILAVAGRQNRLKKYKGTI